MHIDPADGDGLFAWWHAGYYAPGGSTIGERESGAHRQGASEGHIVITVQNASTRRQWIGQVIGFAGGAWLVPEAAASQGAAPARAEERSRFMARALAMRKLAVERGDQPYGAVVVKDGQVVGEGVSAVITAPDPTARGEVQALRDAARRLGTSRLTGCELYTTFRPCPMCETAAYWAGIARIYHGEAIADAGPPRFPPC
jgi:tRNA(Arg) A34 adenosine deaminase TadA